MTRYPAAHGDGHRRLKPDRWLVGLVGGAVLCYLLGRALGLGRGRAVPKEHGASRATPDGDMSPRP